MKIMKMGVEMRIGNGDGYIILFGINRACRCYQHCSFVFLLDSCLSLEFARFPTILGYCLSLGFVRLIYLC